MLSTFSVGADTVFTNGTCITHTNAGSALTVNVSTALVTNGDTTHVPTADAVYDFCETTQDYVKTSEGSGTEYWSVAISSPYALGTTEVLIQPFIPYAHTVSSMTFACQDGTNVIFQVEQRNEAGFRGAGTDVFTGDVTASSDTYKGGTFSDATLQSGYGLYLVITSVSGDVERFELQWITTRD